MTHAPRQKCAEVWTAKAADNLNTTIMTGLRGGSVEIGQPNAAIKIISCG